MEECFLSLTIILPAKNEGQTVGLLVQNLKSRYPEAEILVSDDGSTDQTAAVAEAAGATVLSAPYSMGNGAAIKRAARVARGDVFVFMDVDGQHDAERVDRLVEKLGQGFDMAVGARDRSGQASLPRFLANALYNFLAGLITGHTVPDLTSGFRAVDRRKFVEFLHLLPNGFSYPTTITMAFFRSAYPVAFVPVEVHSRVGKSHIKPLQDGIRFLLIIFKIATLYSPLKLFFPISVSFFLLGLAYYGYTFAFQGRFTNMSVLLLSASVIVFLIGLVSEQITALSYRKTE